MKDIKLIKFIKEDSHMLKKIGVTFVIPILLIMTGSVIFLSAGWNLFSESYNIGSVLFTKANTNVGEVTFNINNQEVGRPDIGQVFATLKIPSLGIERPIVHGDGEDELKKGVGHYAGSTLPGENGNFVISGHRETALKKLEGIKLNDQIFVETSWGVYEYKVKNIKIVEPTEHSVVDPTDYEKITMYTCYPFNYIGHAPKRFVVEGEFVQVSDNK